MEYLKFYKKHYITLLLTLMLAGVVTITLFVRELSHECVDLYSFGIFMVLCATLVKFKYINDLDFCFWKTHRQKILHIPLSSYIAYNSLILDTCLSSKKKL